MSNRTFRGNNEIYNIAKELGKGGEGQVYELQNNNSLVLKLYNEVPDVEKVRKLRFMVSILTPEVSNFAAWPSDLVMDSENNVVGFVMKKLTGYVPLHMLFSPMDRKRIFPDKGYNFLIHVARNLATAFYKLNQRGIIVGDVNEGNILVNASGFVAFIDCDSFQLNDGTKYYFCEVGVPRYTAPELLRAGSFEKVIRTVNTDSFSMSILIFQLLFLGRHPFAGKNISKDDIDEETAIRNYLFAYSLTNIEKKLKPPDDSYEIKNLSQGLIKLFHDSFETNNRPTSNKWIEELGAFSKELINCSISKIHSYPRQLNECPWCKFNKSRGIVYFIDDSYFKVNPIGNIENFVNGFKAEPLSFTKLTGAYKNVGQTPDPISSEYTNMKMNRRWAFMATVIFFSALCFISLWFIAPALLVLVVIDDKLSNKKKINEELKKREMDFITIKSKLEALVSEFNNYPDLVTFNNQVNKFNTLILTFKNLPSEFSNRRKSIEEKFFDEQLHSFLSRFNISDNTIPSFGASKKLTLYKNGIRNASDISKLSSIKVPSIGPKNIQTLLSWQRQISAKFTYKPDGIRLSKEIELVSNEIANKKNDLETLIRKTYQSLQLQRTNILNRQNSLQASISNLMPQVHKAELNYLEFKKVAA